MSTLHMYPIPNHKFSPLTGNLYATAVLPTQEEMKRYRAASVHARAARERADAAEEAAIEAERVLALERNQLKRRNRRPGSVEEEVSSSKYIPKSHSGKRKRAGSIDGGRRRTRKLSRRQKRN